MEKDVDLKELADVDHFRQILDAITRGDDQYIVNDNGQPKAALLPLDALDALKRAKANKETAWQSLFATLDRVHAMNPNVSPEEVDADVDEAIRAIRQGKT